MYLLRRLPAAALLPILVVAGAGCGGGGARSGASSGSPPGSVPDPPRRELKPRISGPQLVRIERIGASAGTHDIVTVGRDGSATVVKAYGGGGFMSEACRLSGAELSRLAREVRGLPLHGRIVHPRERIPNGSSMYAARPTFILDAGGRVETFAQEEMPSDAAPFVRHLERIITAREGACDHTFQQRNR